jgi:hypothetical protein
MGHFGFLGWMAVLILGMASSACLTDITWAELPGAPSDDDEPGAGGRAGASAPGRSGSAGDGGAAAASTLAAGDGGVPDGGSEREDCGASESCLTPSPFPLPAPCAGVRYSAPLAATGGTQPLTWSLREGSSPEFVLNMVTDDDGAPLARIESDGPTLGGVVRVHVEDSSTPPLQADFDLDLSPRESCWFAHLSAQSPTQLHLRDVFLENDVLVGDADVGVLDFQFSPDGRWLAFRQSTPEGARLYTYSARAPHADDALAISLECASAGTTADAGAAASCDVLDYAWSADSNQLAFIVNDAAAPADAISGMSGFADFAGPGAPWPARSTATWVSDEVPLDYREQLRWLDSDRLVFLGDELGSNSTTLTLALYTAEVAPNGAGVTAVEGIPPLLTGAGTTLLGGAGGALLVEASDDSDGSVISFYSPGEPPMFHGGWLSPSGALVGWVEEGTLELYDVRDDESPVASSDDGSAASGSCAAIVAWSDPIGSRERIACAAESALEFFEYDVGAARLVHLARVTGEVAAGARRAFSPDGRWFVFGSGGGARFDLVDLAARSPRVDLTPVQPLVAPVELLYPPTRLGLVNLADAASVVEYPLPGGTSWPSGFTSDGAAPRSACSEAFWIAPAEWCGAPRAARHLAYARDGASLLFEDAPGQLAIAHPGADPRAHRVSDSLGTCSGSCPAGTYAYQP